MRVYRLANPKYISDLSGEGARLNGGRWNHKEHSMLYTSTHLSLAVLEILAYVDYSYLAENFHFIILELPDAAEIQQLSASQLPASWRRTPAPTATKEYGTQWLKSRESMALQVPSAILPMEDNILLNPRHPDFDFIKVVDQGPVDVDERVLK